MKADRILYSHSIFTAAENGRIDGAVAIQNNRILEIGTRQDVEKMIGADTIIEDYNDNTILPGFCDSHVHTLFGCLYKNHVNLIDCSSAEDAALKTKKFYDENRDQYKNGKWVIGFSWYNIWWLDDSLPVKEQLDVYFPDIPVFLLTADAHGSWVNSKALELAGVTSESAADVWGTILRNSNGEPTGYIEENAMAPFFELAFKMSAEEEAALYTQHLMMFSENGITSINEMLPIFEKELGKPEVFTQLADNNKLPLRINFSVELFHDLNYLQSVKEKYSDGKVFFNGGKEFVDGLVFNHTAVMKAPYSDDPDINHDYRVTDFKRLEEAIINVHKIEMNIHLHCCGDGAVSFALDCYEKAIKINGKNKARLSIEHIDLIDKKDIERFGKNGIIASVQPQHLTLTEKFEENPYRAVVGPDREPYLWAYNSIKDSGATLAFGTDFPTVEDLNPMLAIYKAVTRYHDDKQPDGGWNPEEKLSLIESLRAYTYGGAFMAGREEEVGTLEPRKLADIVVLDRDIFSIQAEELLDVKVIVAICDGKVEFQKK